MEMKWGERPSLGPSEPALDDTDRAGAVFEVRRQQQQLVDFVSVWVLEQQRVLDQLLERQKDAPEAGSANGSPEPGPPRAPHPPDELLMKNMGSSEQDQVEQSTNAFDGVLNHHNISLEFEEGAKIMKQSAQAMAEMADGSAFQRSRLGQVYKAHVEPLSEMVSSPPPYTDGMLNRLVHGTPFLFVCSLVIVLNSFFFVVTIDYARTHAQNEQHEVLEIIEVCFCSFYTLELALKLLAFGHRYILSDEWTWNIFDAILVAFAISEQVQQYALGEEPRSNVSFLRGLRLLKLAKVFRVVRVLRIFKELRLIISSILGSMRALQWSMLLVLAFDYLVALVFTQGVVGYLKDLPPGSPVPEAFDIHYSSVGQCMLSLYMSVTGGVSWIELAEPLKELGALYYAIFIGYTAFYMWVLLNTLTSLFVEATMKNSLLDQQQVAEDRLENKAKYIKLLQQWYNELDPQKTGRINYEDLQRRLYDDPRMNRFAAMLEIDLCDVKQFFLAVSNNGTRPVDLDSFVVGCIKLQGHAKSIDLLDLMHTHREFVQGQKVFADFVGHQFSAMRKQIHHLSHQQGLMKHQSPGHEAKALAKL